MSDEAPGEVLYCVAVCVVVVGWELTEEVKCAGQDVAFSSCTNAPCIREWGKEGEQRGRRRKKEEVGRK